MITRNRILFILGIWIVLMPLLGFPRSYEFFFQIFSGVLVALLAFLYARDKRLKQTHLESGGHSHELETDVYAQSHPVSQLEDDDEEKFTDISEIKERSKTLRHP